MRPAGPVDEGRDAERQAQRNQHEAYRPGNLRRRDRNHRKDECADQMIGIGHGSVGSERKAREQERKPYAAGISLSVA